MGVAKGTRYRVTRDIERTALVYFTAPFTGGFKCSLAAGTVLVAVRESDEDSTRVFLAPEDKESYEAKYVPERTDPKYVGFAFSFKSSEIGTIVVPIM